MGEPLYERLMEEGFKSARDVIDADTDELLEIDGLDGEKIKSIKEMMNRELEEADIEEEDASMKAPDANIGKGESDTASEEPLSDETKES